MKNKWFGSILTGGVLLTAMYAYAEDINVSTYYPSPYGSYQNLDTTNKTTLATANSGVSIGHSNDPVGGSKIDARGSEFYFSGGVAGQGTLHVYGGTIAAGTEFLRADGSDNTVKTRELSVYNGAFSGSPTIELNADGTSTFSGLASFTNGARAGNMTIPAGNNTGPLAVVWNGATSEYYCKAVYS